MEFALFIASATTKLVTLFIFKSSHTTETQPKHLVFHNNTISWCSAGGCYFLEKQHPPVDDEDIEGDEIEWKRYEEEEERILTEVNQGITRKGQ